VADRAKEAVHSVHLPEKVCGWHPGRILSSYDIVINSTENMKLSFGGMRSGVVMYLTLEIDKA
jgi:hypothetical protein